MNHDEEIFGYTLSEEDLALAAARSARELAHDWQRLAAAGLAILAGGNVADELARGRLVRALSAGSELYQATSPRQVAAAAARICAEVAAAHAARGRDEGWAAHCADLVCWSWVAA